MMCSWSFGRTLLLFSGMRGSGRYQKSRSSSSTATRDHSASPVSKMGAILLATIVSESNMTPRLPQCLPGFAKMKSHTKTFESVSSQPVRPRLSQHESRCVQGVAPGHRSLLLRISRIGMKHSVPSTRHGRLENCRPPLNTREWGKNSSLARTLSYIRVAASSEYGSRYSGPDPAFINTGP